MGGIRELDTNQVAPCGSSPVAGLQQHDISRICGCGAVVVVVVVMGVCGCVGGGGRVGEWWCWCLCGGGGGGGTRETVVCLRFCQAELCYLGDNISPI